MSDVFSISCPYNCGHSHDISAVAGFQLITCDKCGKPWVMETTYVPYMQARIVEGFGIQCHRDRDPTPEEIDLAIQEDPEEQLCVECGKPISPNSDFRLCGDCLKDDDVENQSLPNSTNSVFPCMVCGVMLPEKYPLSMCEDCYQNKKKADEETSRLFQRPSNSVFLQCPNAPNSLYRLDGDYVEVKYKKGSVVRTTWSDIHAICEEENPTPTIKELLGERSNTNNVAAMNAFVRAVKNGLIEVDA